MKPRILPVLMIVLSLAGIARAEWEKTDTTLAWKNASGAVLWRFSFDPAKGKTFFDPVSAGGPAFTSFKPQDHPWHYGMWFSWKYLNPPGTEHVNYWEESRATGASQGKTAWMPPSIETHDDGSATIRLALIYTNNKSPNQPDMTESRELVISAPTADNAYHIDWKFHFTAGPNGAALDRTAMPGEAGGQVNGGYAGLSVRMAGMPLLMKVITPAGPITQFDNSRARPNSGAVGCNFVTAEGADQGGLAIFSDPANIATPEPPGAPWYIINDDRQNRGEGFRFICAAILAPKILTLKPTQTMDLRYRIAMSPKAWTEESLKAGLVEFEKENHR